MRANNRCMVGGDCGDGQALNERGDTRSGHCVSVVVARARASSPARGVALSVAAAHCLIFFRLESVLASIVYEMH